MARVALQTNKAHVRKERTLVQSPCSNPDGLVLFSGNMRPTFAIKLFTGIGPAPAPLAIASSLHARREQLD